MFKCEGSNNDTAYIFVFMNIKCAHVQLNYVSAFPLHIYLSGKIEL